uniref:Zinc ribbon domain-containing protein n=1 Tax=Caenorhabditis tropicalis TaxID=1561998 RepID=A0A1I7UGL2_9PELO
MAAFICWLPWKSQSKKTRTVDQKEQEYEVIYGGEDSVTKKLLDDYSTDPDHGAPACARCGRDPSMGQNSCPVCSN